MYNGCEENTLLLLDFVESNTKHFFLKFSQAPDMPQGPPASLPNSLSQGSESEREVSRGERDTVAWQMVQIDRFKLEGRMPWCEGLPLANVRGRCTTEPTCDRYDEHRHILRPFDFML